MENKILIIEDESDIQNILRYSFIKEKFKVRCASCGTDGIEICEIFNPDIVILDLMLPDISGFEVLKNLTKYNIPIIMLTARHDIVDKVLGLELGADDYITKPFDIRECIARVKVALRRVEKSKLKDTYIEEDTNEIIIDKIKILKNSRKVFVNNEEIKLKPKEMNLLLYLIENKNIAISRDQIMEKVWDDEYDGDFRTVDVHIRRLRQKLNNKDIIETVFGIGYMLKG
ncbi:response regulator transcription factor [Clostridium baratii]|uniref:response regulator transcription factor n=1 Tax=Clostridium baratii TaxID=1561 RepID=UPI0005F295B2|nr:response regulator transcription factor [Clostridium baratii]AQM58885.1 DNA-binding response regulator [Clostridium baratii]KJU72073.1 XRE family transcriptional regulator [Clostridium baratii]